MSTAPKMFYRFAQNAADGDGADKVLLGGKGAGLALMCKKGLPVPPGFTIPTTYSVKYMNASSEQQDVVNDIMSNIKPQMQWLHDNFGYFPLLSVRSGAAISMPGMMNTILNVGINDDNLEAWGKRIGRRAALDSYRRLIQMLGDTAFEIDHDLFEFQLSKVKKEVGVTLDSELNEEQLEVVIMRFKWVFKQKTHIDFPQLPRQQLAAAIRAVFSSWDNERAVIYRNLNGISHDIGTAVTIQSMVFGNMGEDSGSGVVFTRDSSTGENVLQGDFLPNSQGEDVVAGIRTPFPLSKMLEMSASWKAAHAEIVKVSKTLEELYRDMVDIEFTVQSGTLYMLQSRAGKRSAQAAFRIACELSHEGVLSSEEVIERLTAKQYRIATRPAVDPSFKTKPHLTGYAACPGIATGVPVFSSQDAINSKVPCILVTHETTPDDIGGMNAAVGLLTVTGGATSHAAVVARSMDKPCVVGCTDLDFSVLMGVKSITVDGGTGAVWLDTEVPVLDGAASQFVTAVSSYILNECPYHVQDTKHGPSVQNFSVQSTWGNEDNFISEIAKFVANEQTVVVDLRTPFNLVPDDLSLCSLFGADEIIQQSQFLKKALDHLAKLNTPYVMVLADPGTIVPDNVKRVGFGETLADFMSGSSIPMDPDFVKSFFGTKKALEAFREWLHTKGVKTTEVKTALPTDYIVMERLG